MKRVFYKEDKMEKSFLELLEAERKAICTIKYYKESVIDFLNKAEESSDISDKEACKRIAFDYKQRVIKAELELLQVRKELKNYIAYLQAL